MAAGIGQVFSIEEFSTWDGPGIRTTVFMKGCPLRCTWCHNPEGQSFAPQMVKNPHGCTGCEQCLDMGEALTGQRVLVPESAAVCPRNLIRVSGTAYTPQSLVTRLMKNAVILNGSGGGVTFSGGEPLAQADFVEACLVLLEGRMHRALQTSGYAESDTFERILGHLDYVLYDLKLMDPDLSLQFTGVENASILHNFKTLVRSGVPHSVRIPLIPGVTDTEDNLRPLVHFLKENGGKAVELLPYNRMAGGKYAMVGRTYQPGFEENREVDLHRGLFEQEGISVTVL